MADPDRIEERDGKIVLVTPCDCRSEVVLGQAQTRTRHWQTCLACQRRWLLYILGSGRALWAELGAAPRPARPWRGVWRWRR
jgi:hypothetical protein